LQGKSGGLVFVNSKAYDAHVRMPGGSKKKAKEITEIYTTFLCLLNTKVKRPPASSCTLSLEKAGKQSLIF
jgi:hypothetical protein